MTSKPHVIIPEGTIIAQIVKEDDRTDGYKYYTIGKLLGRGGFGCCYEFTSESKMRHACKIIEKSRLKRDNSKLKLMSEIKIHRALNHHHICKFYDFFDDDQYIYIVMELCP